MPVKGEKPELVVQKLTEIGIDDIFPLAPSAHSVVKWDGDRADRHHARLVKVAREAAMQSRRVWLPEVQPVTTISSTAGACAVSVCAKANCGAEDTASRAEALTVVSAALRKKRAERGLEPAAAKARRCGRA